MSAGNPAKVIKQREVEDYKKLDKAKMHYIKLKKENKVEWEIIKVKK